MSVPCYKRVETNNLTRIKIPSRNETYTEKSSTDPKKYGLGSRRVEKPSDTDKQMCLRAPPWIKHQPGRSFSTQTMLCKLRTGWMTEVSVGAGGNEQNEEPNKIGEMKTFVGNCDSGGVLWDTATSSREMCDLMFISLGLQACMDVPPGRPSWPAPAASGSGGRRPP